jgi:hypothetical protein
LIDDSWKTVRLNTAGLKWARCKQRHCQNLVGVSDGTVLLLGEVKFRPQGQERRWIDEMILVTGLESFKSIGLYDNDRNKRAMLKNREQDGWLLNGWHLRGRGVEAFCPDCGTRRTFAGVVFLFDDWILWDLLEINLDKPNFKA